MTASPSDRPDGHVLEGVRLNAGFGANHVLHDVDLRVGAGELHGIFGLNGAGKSVLLKVLAGLVPAWSGTVRLHGEDVTTVAPEERVARGMGHVPQGRQVFAELTVEENLRVGAYTSRRRDRAGYDRRLAGVYEQLPILADRRDQLAGSLSGGQQAALAVGRALVNEPSVLLIDEPSAGLAPVVVEQLFDVLRNVAAATGLTMLLVEQNVSFGLRLVDTAHLLQSGRIVYEGPVAELDRDRLAGLLGIGSMLQGGIESALAGRRPARTPRKARTARKAAPRKAAPKKPATARKATNKAATATKRSSGTTKKAAPKKAATKKAVKTTSTAGKAAKKRSS